MAKKKQRLVRERIAEIYLIDLEGDAHNVLNHLSQTVGEARGKGYTNLKFYYECAMRDDDRDRWFLYGERPETGKEAEKRKAAVKKERENKKAEKIAKEESDRKMYNRLHKKYGKE
jgi:hypothetical protein